MTEIKDLPGYKVHNPSTDRHFMWLQPVNREITITYKEKPFARTRDATRVTEIGRDVYDPVLYLPAGDVTANLKPNDTITQCPIKGTAQGFDLVDDNGNVIVEYIAWHYTKPVDGAEALVGRIAFTAKHVSIVSTPMSE